MIPKTKTTVRRTNVTQLSPLPDVVDRLNEIRRKLKTAWARCDAKTHRNLIASAEHEICRGILLLEAEMNRPKLDAAPNRNA
jgi:hypothetical protein